MTQTEAQLLRSIIASRLEVDPAEITVEDINGRLVAGVDRLRFVLVGDGTLFAPTVALFSGCPHCGEEAAGEPLWSLDQLARTRRGFLPSNLHHCSTGAEQPTAAGQPADKGGQRKRREGR